MAAPDVSVVVISFNDADRLGRAVASVRRQTLRNLEIVVVDDASTDGTEALVRSLAAADPRIRYERLPANSGGCSAPRNAGMDVARADWVMFCDSDDEYERHACKNLLQAAERSGADIVCGTAERVDARTGRVRRWRPEVHSDVRVAGGLVDFPELLYDTISVNKIYRRDLLQDNGIRFPEGLLFEDQLFTLEAMAAAGSLMSIPQVVYRWYVDRLSDEPSITQRRSEARNVESRIEVNRRIDAFLAERELGEVRRIKDLKFLRHDLYLYLASMLEVDDDTARLLMDRLLPYVSGMDLGPAWELRPALRVAVYHLLVGDLDGIRAAMRYVKWASVVDVPIIRDGGRETWGCSHAADGPDAAGVPARDWLDVTALHLLGIPFSQRRYLHRIAEFSAAAGTISASGTTVDYDGTLSEADTPELRLLVNGERTLLSVAARWTGREGPTWSWSASGLPEGALDRPLAEKDRGTLAVAVRRGRLVNLTGVRSPAAVVTPTVIPYPGPRTATGPDSLAVEPYDNGAVGWRARRTSAVRGRLAAIRDAWFRLPGTTRLAMVLSLVRRDWLPALLRRTGGVLPSRDLALFETAAGRTCGGSARALSDLLRERHPDIRQAWVHRGEPERVPRHAEPVERSSLRHAWLASRARFMVDDGTAVAIGRDGRDTVSVRTGEGIPVHRIGLDDPSIQVSPSAVREVRRRARRWNLVLTASRFDSETTPSALGYSGRIAEVGLVRVDEPLALRAGRGSGDLAARLDLPADRPIVLYAPTARRGDRQPVDPPMDLDRWVEAVGDRAYLLLRPHPSERFVVSTRLRFAVRDIGGRDDLSAFLAAADLFVSDYSSLIGDAALLDVPTMLFQPDRETYVNRTRGLYAQAGSVGPVVATMEALVAEVGAWLDDPEEWDRAHSLRRRAWASDACGPADGHAADRALGAVLAAVDGGAP